jgi:hypothetical protein
MGRRALAPEEVQALGLDAPTPDAPGPGPKRRPLSPEEVQALGLDAPAPAAPTGPQTTAPEAAGISALNSAALGNAPRALAFDDAMVAASGMPKGDESINADDPIKFAATAYLRAKGLLGRGAQAAKNFVNDPTGTYYRASEAYEKGLPKYREGFGQAFEDHPLASFAGGVAGGMAAGPRSIGQAALTGGVAGASSSAADPTKNPLRFLADTGLGAGLSAAGFKYPVGTGAASLGAAAFGDKVGLDPTTRLQLGLAGSLGVGMGLANRGSGALASRAEGKSDAARAQIESNLFNQDFDEAKLADRSVENVLSQRDANQKAYEGAVKDVDTNYENQLKERNAKTVESQKAHQAEVARLDKEYKDALRQYALAKQKQDRAVKATEKQNAAAGKSILSKDSRAMQDEAARRSQLEEEKGLLDKAVADYEAAQRGAVPTAATATGLTPEQISGIDRQKTQLWLENMMKLRALGQLPDEVLKNPKVAAEIERYKGLRQAEGFFDDPEAWRQKEVQQWIADKQAEMAGAKAGAATGTPGAPPVAVPDLVTGNQDLARRQVIKNALADKPELQKLAQKFRDFFDPEYLFSATQADQQLPREVAPSSEEKTFSMRGTPASAPAQGLPEIEPTVISAKQPQTSASEGNPDAIRESLAKIRATLDADPYFADKPIEKAQYLREVQALADRDFARAFAGPRPEAAPEPSSTTAPVPEGFVRHKTGLLLPKLESPPQPQYPEAPAVIPMPEKAPYPPAPEPGGPLGALPEFQGAVRQEMPDRVAAEVQAAGPRVAQAAKVGALTGFIPGAGLGALVQRPGAVSAMGAVGGAVTAVQRLLSKDPAAAARVNDALASVFNKLPSLAARYGGAAKSSLSRTQLAYYLLHDPQLANAVDQELTREPVALKAP